MLNRNNARGSRNNKGMSPSTHGLPANFEFSVRDHSDATAKRGFRVQVPKRMLFYTILVFFVAPIVCFGYVEIHKAQLAKKMSQQEHHHPANHYHPDDAAKIFPHLREQSQSGDQPSLLNSTDSTQSSSAEQVAPEAATNVDSLGTTPITGQVPSVAETSSTDSQAQTSETAEAEAHTSDTDIVVSQDLNITLTDVEDNELINATSLGDNAVERLETSHNGTETQLSNHSVQGEQTRLRKSRRLQS